MAQHRQLAAILFTDIEGYTAIMQRDEEQALFLKDRHRDILQQKHTELNGRIIQYYGDGSLSIFHSAVEAVDCALQMLRAIENKPMIIFTTAHRNIAFEGFELQAIDYLLKPVSFELFTKAVAKAEEYYKFKNTADSQDEYLFVYSEYKLTKIDLNDIEFIESLEDYVRIHLTNGKPILSLMPLKRVLQKLPQEKFQRVHRSYIVSVNKIKGVNNKRIILAAAQVPVSDSYLDVVRKLKET